MNDLRDRVGEGVAEADSEWRWTDLFIMLAQAQISLALIHYWSLISRRSYIDKKAS